MMHHDDEIQTEIVLGRGAPSRRMLTIEVPPALDDVDPRLVDHGLTRHGPWCWTYWYRTHDVTGAGGPYRTRRGARRGLDDDLTDLGVR